MCVKIEALGSWSLGSFAMGERRLDLCNEMMLKLFIPSAAGALVRLRPSWASLLRRLCQDSRNRKQLSGLQLILQSEQPWKRAQLGTWQGLHCSADSWGQLQASPGSPWALGIVTNLQPRLPDFRKRSAKCQSVWSVTDLGNNHWLVTVKDTGHW